LSLNLRLGDLIFISSMKYIQHHQNIYAMPFVAKKKEKKEIFLILILRLLND
jgi:hypothetical protein